MRVATPSVIVGILAALAVGCSAAEAEDEGVSADAIGDSGEQAIAALEGQTLRVTRDIELGRGQHRKHFGREESLHCEVRRSVDEAMRSPRTLPRHSEYEIRSVDVVEQRAPLERWYTVSVGLAYAGVNRAADGPAEPFPEQVGKPAGFMLYCELAEASKVRHVTDKIAEYFRLVSQ